MRLVLSRRETERVLRVASSWIEIACHTALGLLKIAYHTALGLLKYITGLLVEVWNRAEVLR